MLVLGVETSCDETAAAVVEDGRRVRANVVASQIATHAPFGGVVPEVASRQHVATIVPVLERAVADAGLRFADLDAIAVTAGPGLVGALLVGVETAKALAFALGKPLVAVNHLAGHLAAAFLEHADATPPTYPHLALLVSGGHTALIRIDAPGQTRLLGSTRDDAAGEAFDKVGKMLGLGYPGGVAIDKRAATGDPRAVALPRALPSRDGFINAETGAHGVGNKFVAGKHNANRGWMSTRNKALEPHFVDVEQVKKGTKNSDITKLFEGGPNVFVRHGGSVDTGVISPGHRFLWAFHVPKGRYGVLCFWPSSTDGMPHALMGMHTVTNLG